MTCITINEKPSFENIYGMISQCVSALEVRQGENMIIISKDIRESYPMPVQGGNIVAIVDCGNERLVDFVSSTKLPAITCGLSPKDTITLSSIEEDSAVVTLQRAVTCFDGTVAEPQEIPVRLSGITDNFSLMAASAVFILTGNIDQLMDGTLSGQS